MLRGPMRGCFALVVLVVAPACITALPERTGEAALYMDLRKAVESQEGTGWVVDRLEIEDVLPDVAPSICQAEPETRLGVIRWLDGRIAEEGGPARELYARDPDADIDTLLTLERAQAVLRSAHESAEDDCPFWLEEDTDFAGVHGDAARLVVIAESIGGGGLMFRSGEVALGGGGGGRLLFGYGLDVRRTLAIGAEVGGVAELVETGDGGRTLVARFMAAAPVLLRTREGLAVFDVEVTPTVRFSADRIRPPGVRVAIGGGVSTLRLGAFMPHVLLWIGYEYQPPWDGGSAEHSIRIGTRVGVDWDP